MLQNDKCHFYLQVLVITSHIIIQKQTIMILSSIFLVSWGWGAIGSILLLIVFISLFITPLLLMRNKKDKDSETKE